LGRIAGSFPEPPFPTVRVSPIFVIPKTSSTEFRLIHNLSFPPNNSVNDFIDREHCSVKYSSIDDAVKMIHDLGRNALLAKCDIKSAFRLLRLAPNEFDLTASNLITNIISINVYRRVHPLAVHCSNLSQ
jgi:hypothetical protein